MKNLNTVDHILLIDDDNITNLINSRLIASNFNCHVESYVDARAALEFCQNLTDPVLIFLDVYMPEMDGWKFMEEFEKLSSDPILKSRVYMLSSSVNPTDIEKSISYKSVKEFISKPLTIEKIKSVIHQTVE